MARKKWEIADVDAAGQIITRGGIYTTNKATAQRWADANNKLIDVHCIVVEADKDAVTWTEYIRELKAEMERKDAERDAALNEFAGLFDELD